MSVKTQLRELTGRLAIMVPLAMLTLPAYGTAIVDAVTPILPFTGTPLDGLVDGYGTENAAVPQTFSSNLLVVSANNTEFSSSPIAFSNVPYTTIGGVRYFAFVLDSQQTQQKRALSIDSLRISVGAAELWRSTESILLNSNTTNPTLTPLGNGADMAVFVPVSIFAGRSLTGASTFVFSATQSMGSNGNEEWKLTDHGVTGTVQRFSSTDPITSGTQPAQPEPVPEPLSALLLSGGMGFLGLISRRRNRPRR